MPKPLPLFDPAVRNHARTGPGIMLITGSPDPRMTETPDQLTIETPEQVAIHFPLAGIGSRFLAVLADSLLQAVAYLVLFFIIFLILRTAPDGLQAIARSDEKWFIAAIIVLAFLLHWGYFTLFEAFWNGQT